MAITREDYVAQSVDTYLRALLLTNGYKNDTVEIIPEYPHTRFKQEKLSKTYVAEGFDFDDAGKPAEMGSNVKRRLYTIEFFIFGHTPTWGRNVANAVKFSLERDGIIPLLDIAVAERPTIDALVLIGVNAQHEPVNNPLPWQENVWTVKLRLEDTYDPASAVG